ncbi:MEDS domain-containing protein [Actinoplanes sp. CA-054009]
MNPALCIEPGDHAGAAFSSSGAFAETTVAFAERAIAASARVMIFPGGGHRDDPAAFRRLCDRRSRAIAGAGDQVWVGDSRQVQWAPGRFDPDHLRRAYTAATRQAVADGFAGLWVSVDMSWAAAADPGALADFEAASSRLFSGRELTAVCQYDTRVFARPHLAAACRAHPANLAIDSPLRHRSFDGDRVLALSGETDMGNATAFTALLDRLRPGATLDITAMTFLDVRALAAVARTAAEVTGLILRATPAQHAALDLVRNADTPPIADGSAPM